MSTVSGSAALEGSFSGSSTNKAAEANIAPVKRSLFKKKPTWAPSTNQDETEDLFSRSKELFPQVINAERERRKREQDQARLKRRSEEDEKVSSAKQEGKKRRVSAKGESDSGVTSDDEDEEPIRRRGDHLPSEEIKSPAGGSLPPVNTNDSPSSRTRASKTTPRNFAAVISLSDDDDDDDLQPARKITTAYNLDSDSSESSSPVKTTLKPPEPPLLQSDPDDEFASYILQARETNKRPLFTRITAPKPTTPATEEDGKTTTSASTDTKTYIPPQHTARSILTLPPLPPDPIITLLIVSRIEGTTALNVKRKLSQRLKDVRLAWCNRQKINDAPLSEEDKSRIFLTWRNVRLFDVTTCASLGLKVGPDGKLRGDGTAAAGFEDGQILLEAWTEELFQEYSRQKLADRARQARGADPLAELPEEEDDAEAETSESQPPPAAAEPTLRIIVVAKGFPEFKVIVKRSTKISKILNAFKKGNGLAAERVVELRFDGEVLLPDSAAAAADLEDFSKVDAYLRD